MRCTVTLRPGPRAPSSTWRRWAPSRRTARSATTSRRSGRRRRDDARMLSAADASALVGARHADPFAVLGLHVDDEGALWLRAMLPGCSAVAVLDAVSGKRVVALSLRDEAGLWEALIPR